MNIMEFIPVGKENAISRDALSMKLFLADRTVRMLIQEARERGEVILNDQDGAGYYTTRDVGQLERQYRTNRNRALSILRQQRGLRLRIREEQSRDQVTMEEVGTGHG